MIDLSAVIVTPFSSDMDSRAERLRCRLGDAGWSVAVNSVRVETALLGGNRLVSRLRTYSAAAKFFSRSEDSVWITVNAELTLIACFIKAIYGRRVVVCADIYDHHGYIFSGLIRFAFHIIEQLAVIAANFIFLPNSSRSNQYLRWSTKFEAKTFYISNFGFLDSLPPCALPTNRLGASKPTKIVYAGTLDWGRGIERILNLIEFGAHSQICCEIYGAGPALRHFESLPEFSKVYRGGFTFTELEEIYESADMLAAIYDPVVPNNAFCDPNKLREALTYNLPILTNSGTPLAKIVEEFHVGVVFDLDDVVNDVAYKINSQIDGARASLIENRKKIAAALAMKNNAQLGEFFRAVDCEME